MNGLIATEKAGGDDLPRYVSGHKIARRMKKRESVISKGDTSK
jgi:hypothetical protein